MHKKKRKIGAALAIVLMVIAFAVILAFTLAGTGIFHLNVCARTDNSLQARNYAESAISLGIEKVIKDSEYGTNKDDNPLEITLDDQTAGILTFNEKEARKREIPYSTNNISNNASVYGNDNITVPKNSLHLVGVGTCNNVTKRIEAIIHAPPFPFCIASSGKISSQGKLLVGSIDSADSLGGEIDPEKLLPGHILSNSGASDAVTLSGEGKITGDLKSAGGVIIDSKSTIEILGEVKQYSDPVDIKSIDLSTYDPKNKPGVQNLSNFLENPKLEGYCRIDGNLSIAGDLELNGALLFVNGDLNIPKGSVKGKGAIVVMGKTGIGYGAEISSDNLVALLSKGDVNLSGTGQTTYSSFQGIVYTEGNFTADNISLLGAFINKGNESSRVSLTDTNLIAVNSSTDIKITGQVGTNPGAITFKYSDDNSSPVQLKMSVTQSGKYLIEYEPVTKGKGPAGTIGEYSNSDEISRGIIKWWDGLEMQGIYQYKSEPYWDLCPQRGQTYDVVYPRVNSYIGGVISNLDSGGGTGGGTITEEIFSLDLSKFLNIEDRMRIVLWREI